LIFDLNRAKSLGKEIEIEVAAPWGIGGSCCRRLGRAAGFWVPHRSLGQWPPLEAGAAGSNGVVARRRTARVAGWGAA